MKKKILMSIIVLTIVHVIGFAQTKTKKIKDPNLKDTWEEINVLKINQEIREGTYKRYILGKLSVEGNYKNGERNGIWKIYNYNNVVETEINFDSGKLRYLSKDTITSSDVLLETKIIPEGDRPIINLSSSNMILLYLSNLVKYPIYAQEIALPDKLRY